MKKSILKGACFGITSGIITTLGMMVGLNAGTGNKAIVLGGILTIAIADAFSDALGIHVSEEYDHKNTTSEVWAATISTFIGKLLFALSFVIPVLIFNLETAVIISIVWGLLSLAALSLYIAKEKPWAVAAEHIVIAIIVIAATQLVGKYINLMVV